MHTTTAAQSFTNGSRFEADAIAHAINAAVSAGHRVVINGRFTVANDAYEPAKVWGTGTVSALVRTRNGGYHQVFTKPGRIVTVEVLSY